MEDHSSTNQPDDSSNRNLPPSVTTGGGAYTAGNVSIDGGEFVGRDQQIQGDKVDGDKVEGDQIDARESRGFVNRPTGPVTQHYSNTFQIGSFKIPKPLAWGMLALLVIGVGFTGYIALSTDSIRIAVTAPTATPTTTPFPTPTPLAFATEAPDETLIVIATFLVTEGNRNTLAHREIRDKIQEEAQKIGESNLRVALEPTILASDQQEQAKALGQHYHASLVIWGDDTGARVRVNFLNLRQPDFDAATVTINETERTQLANPQAYNQFVIEDLPRQLTFLSLFAVGQSYYINQDYSHAIETIEAATTSLPTNVKPLGLAEAFFRLGWLYSLSTQNNLNKAITNYDKAIQLDPDNVSAYTNRGHAREAQGKLEEAIADYDKAIDLDPDDASTYVIRGQARHDQGKLDEAIADFTQAIALDPDFAAAYMTRGYVRHDQGKLDEAIADFTQAIDLDLTFAGIYAIRGLTRYKQGKLDEAIADYDKAIDLDPDDASAYYNRGLTRYKQGKLEEAIADYDKAIALSPEYAAFYNTNYAAVYNNRGLTRYKQGKLDEAIADFTQAIALDPDDAAAYNSLCWTYSLQRDPTSALPNCQLAIEIDPAPGYYDSRGLAYALLGDFPAALADFQKFVEFLETLNHSESVKDLEKRKQWIVALKAGKNPFTSEVLEELKHE